tara:strand:+ start:284 stop:481 length:198 start_codon:yes stop_codon:yes gene_type:complete
MPVNVVKTKRDERLWAKAKARASSEGKSGNYAYIMGIYKRMKARQKAAKPQNPRMGGPKRKHGTY